MGGGEGNPDPALQSFVTGVYHVRQSFCPGEITPEEANRLGMEFAKRFTKGKHAFIVCTHIDKAHSLL